MKSSIELMLHKRKFGNSTYFYMDKKTFELLGLELVKSIKVLLLSKEK